MARKAVWILVLLVALLAVSAGAALASSVLTLTQASAAPAQELSTSGKVYTVPVSGTSSGSSGVTKYKSYDRGNCPFDGDSASSEAAY